jgi:uncharacterized protein involved in exopolysaccharide biosynthesis
MLRTAAGLFAAAIVVMAWQAWTPQPLRVVQARVQIAPDAVSSTSSEAGALARVAMAHGLAMFHADSTDVIEVSLLTRDPVHGAVQMNGMLEAYLRALPQERAARAAVLLEETTEEWQRQEAVVRDSERRLEDARTRMARARRAFQTSQPMATDSPTQLVPTDAEYASLFRRVETERQRADALRQRAAELAHVARAPGSAARVLEWAAPEPEPDRPDPWPVALGLLAAAGAALYAPAIARALHPDAGRLHAGSRT